MPVLTGALGALEFGKLLSCSVPFILALVSSISRPLEAHTELSRNWNSFTAVKPSALPLLPER